MALSDSSDALSIEDIYTVFGNPIRRKIVEIIAERGAVSFTELKRSLNLSVGALYYNLDGLKDFITKDENRKYVLTAKGVTLYKAMKEGDEAIKRALEEQRSTFKLLDSYVLRYLVPQQLFIPLYGNNTLSLIVAMACMTLGLLTSLFTRLPLKILEVEQVPISSFNEASSFILKRGYLIFLNYTISVLILLIVVQLSTRFLTRNRPPLLGLLAGLLVAQLPLYGYMLVQWIITGWSYPNVPTQTIVALAVTFRLFQVVSLCLLTAAISVFYRFSRERSFLIASLLLYISFFARHLLPA
ncbi:MAG: hypothetical protein QXG48_01365 [Thermofilaceae archaeon]